MRFAGLLLLLLAVCPVHGNDSQQKGNTMMKVVNLLQEMLEKSKDDAANDQEIFAKFKCYCGKTLAEKTKSIQDLSDEIDMLDGQVNELQGASEKLSTQVATLDKRMMENEAARKSADELREKAKKDFVSEEEDMNQAMDQMGVAIQTLEDISIPESAALAVTASKVGKTSLRGLTADGQPLPRDMKHALKAAAIFLNPIDRKRITNFVQLDAYRADQASPIVGILKQMKDTFNTNLKNAQAGEAAAVEAHTNYMETAEKQFETMKTSKEGKEDLLGSNEGDLGTAKSSLDTAGSSRQEEEEFVESLNKMCADKTEEYEQRKTMRANEDAAVAQAISILNSDSAFDVFGKTKATSEGATGLFFFQKGVVRSHKQTKQVQRKVSGMIQQAARSQASFAAQRRLQKIAALVGAESNPFDIVVKQIEKQMNMIDKEEKADDDQKAWCDAERENNEALRDDKKSNIERLQGELDQTVSDIEEPGSGLKAVLAEAQQNLADTQTAMQTLTEDRQAENGEYRTNVANLAEAEETIEKALKVLVDYYDWLHRKQAPHSYEEKSGKGSSGGGIKRLPGASVDELEEACSADPNCAGFSTDGWLKKELQPEEDWFDDSTGASLYVKVYEGTSSVTGNLLQVKSKSVQKDDPKPPSTWEDESAESGGGYAGQTESGGKAVDMLRFILDETKAEEKNAHETEEKAQAGYEDEMQRLTDEENQFLSTVADTERDLAEKEKVRAETSMNLDQTKKDKTSIENFLADIKHNCDFIDENMDARKEARRAEKSALKEASESLQETPEFKSAEEADAAKEAEKGKLKDTAGTD